MWLVFSLLAPLFFAVVHVLDAYCVEDVFEKPWLGMITGALASIVIFAPLPYILPFVSVSFPSTKIILLALFSGALIQLSQGLYFQALAYSEAGIVAAYWNMVPAFVPIISFFAYAEILSFVQYIGIILLIISSVFFSMTDTNLDHRKKTLGLMIVASILQAFMFPLEKIVYSEADYFIGFYLITTGLIITGVLPLLSSKVRRVFVDTKHLLIPATKIFIGVEVINLLALACSQRAVDLGIPSLVAAVETTIPAYTFIFLIILNYLLPKLGDKNATSHIGKKFSLVSMMVIGVLLVS